MRFISFPVQVSLVYGQMNEPPGARARVALTGLTVAEYFRDKEGQDVLLFIDNIFRFTQAGSEVSGDTITRRMKVSSTQTVKLGGRGLSKSWRWPPVQDLCLDYLFIRIEHMDESPAKGLNVQKGRAQV